MHSPDSERRKKATLEKWQAILSNKTFQAYKEEYLVGAHLEGPNHTQPKANTPLQVPGGVKPLGSKWVHKKKINHDGSTRFKVRLVIRGFKQRAGTDYTETYAPVV